MVIGIVWVVLSIAMLWIGSGMAVSEITRIARVLRLSSFWISFFVLGLFTSITEIMVGINAYLYGEPEIFVGNLIGSSVVVFLLVIPLLAIAGNGIKTNHTFCFRDMVAAVLTVGVPSILTLDNVITGIDAVISIVLYGYLIFIHEKNTGTLNHLGSKQVKHSALFRSFLRIAAAVAMVFVAANILVVETVDIGSQIGISPYILSIVMLSVGTNIPELTIAVRSVLLRKKEIAFGDYVGSASLNTLELGLLSLLTGKPIPANGSNFSVLIFAAALLLFLKFGRSGKTISRREGILLLGCYIVFLLLEVRTGPGWEW